LWVFVPRNGELVLTWFRFSGVAASAVFWIFTLISINLNPWFDFYRDAFSDLGGSRANNPWIYNAGLVVSSIFIELLSIHMISSSRSKLGVVAGSYFSIAGIFLAMIAIFPSGTRPHVFISTWFFIQAFLGAFLYGAAMFREDRSLSIAVFATFVIALAGSITRWPSAASLEAFEIVLLTFFAVLYALRG
jgi:hypothetical membrane protein